MNGQINYALRIAYDYGKKYYKYQIVVIALWFCKIIVGSLVPFIQRDLFNSLLDLKLLNNVLYYVFLLIITYIVLAILDFYNEYKFNVLKKRVIGDTWFDMYKKIQFSDINDYRRYTSGEALSRIISDSDMYGPFISGLIPSLIVNIVRFMIVLIVLTLLHKYLTLIVLLSVFPYYVLFQAYGSNIMKSSTKERKAYSKMVGSLKEKIDGLLTIKLYSVELIFKDYLLSNIDEWFNKIKKTLRIERLYITLYSQYSNIISIIILGIGTYFYFINLVDLGTLIAFFGYMRSVYEPISNVAGTLGSISRFTPAVKRVLEVLKIGDEEIDKGHSINHINEIEFKNISFYYPENVGDYVIKNVNSRIRKDEIIALVGRSGSGKSTLSLLLVRLYKNLEGKILINARNIDEYKIKNIRQNIILLAQDPFIFDSSIKDNITLWENFNENEISKVAELCDINNIPRGLESRVGERGSSLSGGQKQRIALARTIIRKPQVLILDEATSELDSETESMILNNIKSYLTNSIIIIIAHRLSTIKSVDKIIVLENGQIVDEGSHDELLMESREYADLIKEQLIYKNDVIDSY